MHPVQVDPILRERSGELKRGLLDFVATRPRLARDLNRRLSETPMDECAAINLTDHFILQARMPDGRTVVEQYCASHRELSAADRDLLLAWRDVVEGVFEIVDRDADSLLAVNLVDELTYRVVSNLGSSGLEPIAADDFLYARIVPFDGVWMLSGMSSVRPPGDAARAFRAAAEVAMRVPKLVFRNPAKLARAWELQHQERAWFVEFFGADEVVLAGAQAQCRWSEFWTWRLDRNPEQRQSGGPVPFNLPEQLTAAETVGLVYDEVEGLVFLGEYGLVKAAFADPGLAASRPHREVVLGYLKDETISAQTMCRLANIDPDAASELFGRLLKKPRFRWERDGEDLLRRHKPESFGSLVLPRISPLGERLVQALRAA